METLIRNNCAQLMSREHICKITALMPTRELDCSAFERWTSHTAGEIVATRGFDEKTLRYNTTTRWKSLHSGQTRVFICAVNNQRTSRGVCNQDPLGPHPRRYTDRCHHHVGSDAVDCLAPRFSTSTRRGLDTRGGRPALRATSIFPLVVSVWCSCTKDLR